MTTAVLIGWIPLTGPAGAQAPPFTDRSANGYIGFCDQHGHQISSGSVGAAPFAWTAVSSTPAPAGFPAGSGRGVLNVYQPRKEVDPGDWSGKQLTAASTYTNTTYPMAQATGADPALVDFVSVFPPRWDGLVQLRMYFTGPNQPMHTAPYPATVIRVTGERWTVVSGGNVPCNAGKATSAETISLPSSILQRPTARSTPGAARPSGVSPSSPGLAVRPGTTRSSKHTDSPQDPTRAVAASEPAAESGAAAQKTTSSGELWRTIGWIVLAVAIVAGAAAAIKRWRRDDSY